MTEGSQSERLGRGWGLLRGEAAVQGVGVSGP